MRVTPNKMGFVVFCGIEEKKGNCAAGFRTQHLDLPYIGKSYEHQFPYIIGCNRTVSPHVPPRNFRSESKNVARTPTSSTSMSTFTYVDVRNVILKTTSTTNVTKRFIIDKRALYRNRGIPIGPRTLHIVRKRRETKTCTCTICIRALRASTFPLIFRCERN